MENETIAKLISIFETTTLVIAIILAIAGVAVLIIRTRAGDAPNTTANSAAPTRKINRIKRFTQNAFIRALCIAALVAFLPELTYFNYQYYLRYFAGEEIATTIQDPENPQHLRLTNGGVAEVVDIETGSNRRGGIGLRFNNLDQVITSIHIDVEHEHTDVIILQVDWQDEEGTPYSFQKRLFKGLPHDYHIPLQPRGNVSELSLIFAVDRGVKVHIKHVTLNTPIPFYFSGLRLLVLTFILFMIITIANKNTRAQLSCALFQYKFDAKNKKQTWAYVATIFIALLLSWLSIYTALASLENISRRPQVQQYNVYLVDAIIAGRTWLDYGNPKELLAWERPYDNHWRNVNGKVEDVDWMHDWAWYKGRYYSYFGVVPALILNVPYKLITGNYLSIHGSIFIFCAVAIVMLALLWRYCVIKWMPNARFAFFILGFLTLFFASGMNVLFVFVRFHSIVQAAGLMFAITGVYLLLKSIDKEKVNYTFLFFACLSLALIAGSRPTMLFISILVPILLWKRRSWKVFAFAALPYVIVAIPLMWYNYIRFDSITDFGANYNLTLHNMPTLELLNPIGRVIMALDGFLRYMFLPAKYSLEFPYVELIVPATNHIRGIYMFAYERYGLINYPIILCLLLMFKKSFRKNALQETLPMLYGFLAAAVMTMFAITSILMTYSRYIPDFATFIILPSLFCAYGFSRQNQNELSEKTHIKLAYLLMIMSITVGAILLITGNENPALRGRNPMLYQWLESVLSII